MGAINLHDGTEGIWHLEYDAAQFFCYQHSYRFKDCNSFVCTFFYRIC